MCILNSSIHNAVAKQADVLADAARQRRHLAREAQLRAERLPNEIKVCPALLSCRCVSRAQRAPR